jgi:ribonuclease HII
LATRKEPDRTVDVFYYEDSAAKAGFSRVAGIDEAGRGPLAGPVVAAAVVVRDPDFTERIDDSKKLTERMRERAFLEILEKCDHGIGLVDVAEIDRINIRNATLKAMRQAVAELDVPPDHLLIDGRMELDARQSRTYINKGDSLSFSIACASIVAKVFRDRLMVEHDRSYPVYGFRKHKGYGTRQHIQAIRSHGLCPLHRRSFGPFGGRREPSGRTRKAGAGPRGQ